MESVKRFSVGFSNHSTAEAVFADDFDRVSAENLALQQRLTVQDQRVDELLKRISETSAKLELAASMMDDDVRGNRFAEVCRLAIFALKPTAEAVSHVDCGSCRNITDGCKGKCQRSEEWSKP